MTSATDEGGPTGVGQGVRWRNSSRRGRPDGQLMERGARLEFDLQGERETTADWLGCCLSGSLSVLLLAFFIYFTVLVFNLSTVRVVLWVLLQTDKLGGFLRTEDPKRSRLRLEARRDARACVTSERDPLFSSHFSNYGYLSCTVSQLRD
ncbi:hypothetical protein GGS23DRAFT_223744 [Durotheca rogersii]|uniref:uncharacterized protein n=1 Tax=Durotheca rogersii TaxID=419775 RepID=UPI00221F59C1|nr:uncharacterized protein GGS23DRAFT_223744 [Durotheca rogersii]KAI5860748.1 hypothetical protein GGS23DRAFT_223744 [Durotheca rogersii]